MKTEKYHSWHHYGMAYLYRSVIRNYLKRIVEWEQTPMFEDGCTVVLGMASRLKHVLAANLNCLMRVRWPEMKQLIISVDAPKGVLDQAFVDDIQKRFGAMNISFTYYSDAQYRVTERLKLPYIYSWLSWANAMRLTKTRTVLIHDYDALVLSNVLEKRYREFVASKAVMQGIMWYRVNGLQPEDGLATTFEAFADLAWIKRYPAVEMFNQVGVINGRRVDFDTLLDMQARYARPEQRTIHAMGADDLVHPTQMIHQYTQFRKNPGGNFLAASLVMIPFFYYLSGMRDAIAQATARVREARSRKFELLGDGVLINFETFLPVHVNQMLRQMLQVCVRLPLPPFRDLVEYGEALYDMVNVPPELRWTELDPAHLDWVRSA